MKRTIASITLAAFVAGCATQGANVTSSYVPASRYSSATCESLAVDLVNATQAETALSGSLDSAANKDAALVAVGLILFWPALFFVGQDKTKEAELARVKGERIAIQRAMSEKKCAV
jgi:hypothetical protein